MNSREHATQLKQFREQVYQNFTDELHCQEVNFFWQNAEEYSMLKN